MLRPAPVNYFRGGSRLRTSQSSAFRQKAALTFSCADTRKSAHPSVGAPVVSPNLAAAADHQLVEYPAGVDHPGVRVHGCACTVGMAGRRRKEKLMFIQTVASKPRRWALPASGLMCTILVSGGPTPLPAPAAFASVARVAPTITSPMQTAAGYGNVSRSYPWHTAIVATTFWVGEIFDPNAADGSQVYSTYDSSWEAHYGGCDGVSSQGGCQTEKRLAPDYFPQHMSPKENPFYLDLPFDDINNATAFRQRCNVEPWAKDPGYAGHCTDPNFSYMKNYWVRIKGTNGQTCYGQIQDAGPGQYHDATYVFGGSNSRPVNHRYGGAGMDVSPALNGCLGMKELNGDTDKLSWQFATKDNVPPGPWTKIVTTSGVLNQ